MEFSLRISLMAAKEPHSTTLISHYLCVEQKPMCQNGMNRIRMFFFAGFFDLLSSPAIIQEWTYVPQIDLLKSIF